MAAQLVLITANLGTHLQLTCGHTSAGDGEPSPATSWPPQAGEEWYCDHCGEPTVAQIDQRLARVREQRQPR
jgi:hypothetical protein